MTLLLRKNCSSLYYLMYFEKNVNCGLILYTVDTGLITSRISRETNTTSILLFIQRGTPRYLITSLPRYLNTYFSVISLVNHHELTDRGLTWDNAGRYLQVYNHDNGRHPTQIHRVLSGLGTTLATAQFRLQAPMSANTVDNFSYVVGSWWCGQWDRLDYQPLFGKWARASREWYG